MSALPAACAAMPCSRGDCEKSAPITFGQGRERAIMRPSWWKMLATPSRPVSRSWANSARVASGSCAGTHPARGCPGSGAATASGSTQAPSSARSGAPMRNWPAPLRLPTAPAQSAMPASPPGWPSSGAPSASSNLTARSSWWRSSTPSDRARRCANRRSVELASNAAASAAMPRIARSRLRNSSARARSLPRAMAATRSWAEWIFCW